MPEEKIASRYERSLSLLPAAIASTNRAYLFDNSMQEHLFIAEFEEGKLVWVDQHPPAWFVKHVLDRGKSR